MLHIRPFIAAVALAVSSLVAPEQQLSAQVAGGELSSQPGRIAGEPLDAGSSRRLPALSVGWSDTTAIPLDLRVARAARAPGLRESDLMGATSAVTGLGAFPGTLLLAGILYGLGERDDDQDLSDLGIELGTAAGASLGATIGVKLLVGRARPDVSPDAPHDVAFGRGFRGNDYQSFPSAHTAMAFATATVITGELGSEGSERYWVPPAAYGLATLAGLSRIYHDEHWLTDVIAGAVVGLLTGVVVQLE